MGKLNIAARSISTKLWQGIIIVRYENFKFIHRHLALYSSFLLNKWINNDQHSFLLPLPEKEALRQRNLQPAYSHGLKCKFPTGRNRYLLLYLRVSKVKGLLSTEGFCIVTCLSICLILPWPDHKCKRSLRNEWGSSALAPQHGGEGRIKIKKNAAPILKSTIATAIQPSFISIFLEKCVTKVF